MLKTFRKNTKVIVWTVVVSFGLWGAYAVGVQFQSEGRVAGEVFGKSVNFQDFDRFYRANQIFSFTGKPIEDPELLKQQTWQSIIYWREAKQRKIQVTDDEVRTEIQRLLAAEGISNLTPQIYQRWLQATVKEPPQLFERQIRELLEIRKLVLQVHDSPVDLPTREQAQRQFLLESQKLEGDVIQFDTFEEATNFYLKAKSPQSWAEQIKKQPALKVVPTGLVSLWDLTRMWQVSEEDAFSLFKTPRNSIASPIPTGSLYGVLYIKDKKEAGTEAFTKETEEIYSEKLEKERKDQRFLQWNFELQQRAGLKDYLPKPENVPSGEPDI